MLIKAKCVANLGAGLMLALAAGVASAADAPCRPLSHVQKRILAAADQGMPQLRDLAWMTSRIYGIDMFQIAESIDQWRDAANCAAAVAAKGGGSPEAALAANTRTED